MVLTINQKKMNRIQINIFLFFLTFGCLAQATNKSPLKTDFAVIKNQQWYLQTLLKNKYLTNGNQPYIHFSDTHLSGFAGCNQIKGNYTIENNHINIQNIKQTKKFCQESIELENRFVELLYKTHKWKFRKNKFILKDEHNKKLLIFTNQQ